jgi:hypothetical protein
MKNTQFMGIMLKQTISSYTNQFLIFWDARAQRL